jgi:hypothetical protein
MTEEQSKKERDNLLRKAYGTATAQLREKYKDEFLLLQQSAAQKLGLDWSPRKSKEQRDREKVQKILADNPAIKAELIAEIKAQEQG